MAHEYLFSTADTVISNLTVRFVRISDGYIYDNNASAYSATTTWANSLSTITKTANLSAYPITVPRTKDTNEGYAMFYYSAAPLENAAPDKVWKFTTGEGGVTSGDMVYIFQNGRRKIFSSDDLI